MPGRSEAGRSSLLSASRVRPARRKLPAPFAPSAAAAAPGSASPASDGDGAVAPSGSGLCLIPRWQRLFPRCLSLSLLSLEVLPSNALYFSYNSSVWGVWKPGFSHVLGGLGIWWLPAGRRWILPLREGRDCGQAEMSFSKKQFGGSFCHESSCDKHSTLPALLS